MHFNENTAREQAVTAAGVPQYAISYPKFKHGAPIAKQVKVAATFSKYTYLQFSKAWFI